MAQPPFHCGSLLLSLLFTFTFLTSHIISLLFFFFYLCFGDFGADSTIYFLILKPTLPATWNSLSALQCWRFIHPNSFSVDQVRMMDDAELLAAEFDRPIS